MTANVVVTGYVSPKGREAKIVAEPYMVDPRPGACMDGYLATTGTEPGGTPVVQFDFFATQELVLE